VTSSDEDVFKLTLDFAVAQWLDIRTTLRHQERKAEHYDAHYFEESFPTGEPAEAEANEGMRRYYWTDRDLDGIALQLDATATEKLSFYGEVAYTDNEYTDPNTGLKIGQSYAATEDRDFNGCRRRTTSCSRAAPDDKSMSYSLGVAYAANERFHVYGDYTWDSFEYGLETRYRNVSGGIGTDNPLDNWGSDIDDDYDTASVGLDYVPSGLHTMTLALDASWSRGTGRATRISFREAPLRATRR
jgi:hypothetical protein